MPAEQLVHRRHREVAQVLDGRSCRTRSDRSGRARTGTRWTATPVGFSKARDALATKPLVSATCASTLLACKDIGLLAFGRELAGQIEVKKAMHRVDADRASPPRPGAFAGSMPSTVMPASTIVLQQVAVVARELDDQAVGPELARRDRSRRTFAANVRCSASETEEK